MKKLLMILMVAMLSMSVAFADGGVTPIFECWQEVEPGYYTAQFGYENNVGDGVIIDEGENNKLTGVDESPITSFDYPAPNHPDGREGRSGFFNVVGEAPMSISWNGDGNIVWTLDGKTATAGLNGPECTYEPEHEEVPEFGVLAAGLVLGAAGIFIAARRRD